MNDYIVEHLKRILENYRYVNSEIKICKLKLEELDVKRGVHAIRYDKEATQGSIDPLTKSLNELELIEQYTKYEMRLEKSQNEMNKIKELLNNISEELRQAVFDIHCVHKKTYYCAARELYMDESTLKRRVNKELQRIATEVNIN